MVVMTSEGDTHLANTVQTALGNDHVTEEYFTDVTVRLYQDVLNNSTVA